MLVLEISRPQWTWVQILIPSLVSDVTIGKLLNPSLRLLAYKIQVILVTLNTTTEQDLNEMLVNQSVLRS